MGLHVTFATEVPVLTLMCSSVYPLPHELTCNLRCLSVHAVPALVLFENRTTVHLSPLGLNRRALFSDPKSLAPRSK